MEKYIDRGLNYIARLFYRPSGNISDINKKAAENTINMVCLYSSNIDFKKQQKMNEAVLIKTRNTFETVINSFLGKDPEEAVQILSNMLQNSVQGNPLNAVNNFNGRLSEELSKIPEVSAFNIVLSEGENILVESNSTTPPQQPATIDIKNAMQNPDFSAWYNRQYARRAGDYDRLSDNDKSNMLNLFNKRGVLAAGKELKNLNDLEKAKREQIEKANLEASSSKITHSSMSGYNSVKGDDTNKFFTTSCRFTFIISGINSQGTKVLETFFSFNVKINAITLEANDLIDAMGEVNTRDTWYQFLKFRAGKALFWRDVVLNINAIKTMADRNTRGKMSDRVVAQLVNGSNVILPNFIRDFWEFKKFTVIITLDDADILKSKYDLSIYKSTDLHRLFQNMSMLTLIVMDTQDEDNARVTMFDSDNPNTAFSYRFKLKDKDLADDLAKALNRRKEY